MISLVYLLHIDVKMTVESRQYINPPYKITDRDNKADNSWWEKFRLSNYL